MDKQKTFFLVDDDEDDLFIMGEAISDLKLDINVCYASNGNELLELLQKNLGDALILIDMNMPVMNGIETLRAIYADPKLKHFPSVLMSTSDNQELEKAALDAGAQQFICKPTHYEGYILLIREIYQRFL